MDPWYSAQILKISDPDKSDSSSLHRPCLVLIFYRLLEDVGVDHILRAERLTPKTLVWRSSGVQGATVLRNTNMPLGWAPGGACRGVDFGEILYFLKPGRSRCARSLSAPKGMLSGTIICLLRVSGHWTRYSCQKP